MPLPRGPLLWSDEFGGTQLDERRWRYEPTASMAPSLNEELQRYVDHNDQSLKVMNGTLTISAFKDAKGAVVSTRISTYGLFSFTYGIVEARMKVPYEQGFWPAFWMLGRNVRTAGWPSCGEIDIMEVFGHRRGPQACSTVHNPMHSWGTKDPLDGGCADLFGHLDEKKSPDWHVWKVLWTPTRIAFFIDDNEDTPIWSYERSTADREAAADGEETAGEDGDEDSIDPAFPYTLPQYFILNLAVGGNGPSEPVDESVLTSGSAHLSVDYVRVYSLGDGLADAALGLREGGSSGSSTAQGEAKQGSKVLENELSGSWFVALRNTKGSDAVEKGHNALFGAAPARVGVATAENSSPYSLAIILALAAALLVMVSSLRRAIRGDQRKRTIALYEEEEGDDDASRSYAAMPSVPPA